MWHPIGSIMKLSGFVSGTGRFNSGTVTLRALFLQRPQPRNRWSASLPVESSHQQADLLRPTDVWTDPGPTSISLRHGVAVQGRTHSDSLQPPAHLRVTTLWPFATRHTELLMGCDLLHQCVVLMQHPWQSDSSGLAIKLEMASLSASLNKVNSSTYSSTLATLVVLLGVNNLQTDYIIKLIELIKDFIKHMLRTSLEERCCIQAGFRLRGTQS